MGKRRGSGPDLVHVWVAPVDGGERSAAHDLLVALADELMADELTADELTGGPGAALRHDAAGRPWVELASGGPLWASVSHARGLVAVAASSAGPVGVDLETRRNLDPGGMARRWFDPAEADWLAGQPDQVESFLRLWTAKEAVGKALGSGLRGAGLRRRMPLDATAGGGLVAGTDPALAVLHPPLPAVVVLATAVLAVAVPAGATEVLVTERTHQGAALRSTAVSRTSFPVVVRGN